MRPSGSETFGELLGAGLPVGGTVLLIGGPGSGKRRLAAGLLNRADEGRYVTVDEPAAGVGRGLPLSESVHRATIDCSGDEPVVRDVESDGGTTESMSAAADTTAVVVVDGVDTLCDRYGDWSAVVGLLDDVAGGDGTCVVVGTEPDDALLRHATVIVECWQEAVGGDYQSFCRVRQHRTAVHDGRRHRLARTPDGAEVVARERTGGSPRLATDIDAFDDLTGGGFARGGTTVFEHDGTADHWPFTGSVCAHVIERGATVVCITAPGIVTSRVNDHLEPRVGDVQSLMNRDALYVVDTVSQADDTATRAPLPADNVILQSEVGSIQEAIRSLVQDLSGRPVLAVLEITPLLHLVEDDQARQLFYWASANVLAMEGLSLVLAVDRDVAGDQLAAFFSGSAEQVFRTWQADDGIRYVTVEKSPDGSPGYSRAVEPIDDPPYVRLR